MLSPALKASAQERSNGHCPQINNTIFVPRAWRTYIGGIMSLVQEAPLAFVDDLSLIPAAAEAWKRPNEVAYIYTLRSSDGSPLTPEDVIASFWRAPQVSFS